MTPQQRLRSNVEALEVVRTLMKEGREATAEEREILGRYRGWGGVDLGRVYSTNMMRRSTTGRWGTQTENDKLLSRLVDIIDDLDPNGERGVLSAVNRAALTSYYTPTAVAKVMNGFVEQAGFKGGNMLDPSMGSGVFEGTMSKDIQQRTMIHGIELDWLTGQIARNLYPDANVLVTGYEQAGTADNAYDVVMSNIPFGDLSVTDKTWKHDSSPVRKAAQNRIHNYFAVKMIDNTRPGGLCVIMTSNAILDTKGNQIIREHFADQAEVLGAVRLPDNTFKGAGTSVVTDVIFLRKFKDEADRTATRGNEAYTTNIEKPFLSSGELKLKNPTDGKTYKVAVNGYFAKNKDMMIGDGKAGGQYRADEFGLGSAMSTDEIAKAMGKLIEKKIIGDRKGKLFDTHKTEREVKQAVSEAYKGDGDYISSGNIVEQDGIIGVVTSTKNKYGDVTTTFTEMPSLKSKADRIQGMFPVRKAMKQLIDMQIQGEKEHNLSEVRAELQKAYDDFVKKYGRLNDKGNDFLTEDIDGYTLRSLEKYDDGKFVGLSDIFTKNTIKPALDLTTAKTPQDAISLSLAEYGEINPSFMKDVLGESWAEQCGEMLFRTPFTEDEYETADAYLSGDVKTKLEQARAAVKEDASLQRNVEALEAIQPKDIPFEDISIRMGARWVPAEVYTDFMFEQFGIQKYEYRSNKSGVEYMPEVDQYVVNVAKNELGGEADAWRTSRRSASEVFTAALQDKSLSVFDTIKEDGKETKVLNKEETELLNNKIQDLRTAFEDWIGQQPEREEMLMRLYNDKFNRTVLRKFDGSHLNVAGLMGKELRPHQKDAVWMLINNRGGIVDHIVGAGKTLVMQSAIMEMRRMGIAKKPMIIALKSTVAQIAKEFREAYPAARILAPTEKDFASNNRKKFMAQIALNDYDCVILSHDQYNMLPHTEEVERSVIDEQKAQLDNAIEFLYGQDDKSQLTKKQIKGLEKRKNNLETKLTNLLDRKIDREFTFEGLGVDYLFVDECQHFKSLPYVSTYDRVAGLGDKKGSQKAIALLNGVRYLQKMHQGDQGTVFLSGTTISNSLSEIYHLLNYLRPSEMERLGMTTFDAWAGNFAIHTAELEYGVTSELKEKDRFRSLTNIPELAKMYAEIADVRNDLNLKLPKPKMRSHIVTVPQTDLMQEINREIVNMVKGKDGSYFNIASNDNTPWGLLASTLSAKAAINPRLIDESWEAEGGKIPAVCENVKKIYDQFAEQKGTQLIFCDTGVPGKGKKYDAYTDIINRLVNDYGIPRKEIADIHEANTDEKRKELFAKVNDGSVRILIGGTKNMGTGVNVQKRIVAMHHVDVPWTPADREQREGRGVRQGNEIARDFNDDNVDVYFYATEGSLDMYKYQLQETKGKLFAQFKSGTIGDRTFDEGDAEGDFDPAEVVAMLSGNPVIFEKSKQDKKVEKLRRAKRAYESDWQRRHARYDELQTKKSNFERLLSLNASDVRELERGGFTPDAEGKYPTTVTVSVKDDYSSRKTFDKPKEAGAYIHELLKQGKKVQLSGFHQTANISIPITDAGSFGKPVAELESYGGIKYAVEVSDDDTAAGVSFRNLLQKVYNNRKVYERNIEDVNNQLKGADPGENAFPKQTELDEALKEKKRLDEEYKKLSDEEEKPSANDDTRYRDFDEEVNELFNEALQKQIDGVLPKGYVYNLGMPNDILHSAGIPNLPIELVASRLSDKAMQENHPFDLSEVKDLPHAIQNPLAVFRSATHIGSNVILTNLKHGGRNYVVAVETNRKAGKIYVNSVRSVHYRNSLNIIGWINDGLVDYISDGFRNHWVEEKKNELLSKPQYNSVDVRKKLISAAKIVKDFKNPNLSSNKMPSDDGITKFRVVRDGALLAFLDGQPTKKGFRYAQWANYGVLPPMTAKRGGEWRTPMVFNRWEQSEEGMRKANGKADLVQGNGRTTGDVAYNPYFHIRTSPLNDQFTAAYDRPELIVVEGEYPVSEETSGYRAEGAKDSVGLMDWHSGSVNGQLDRDTKVQTMLSRYFKPRRIVPWSEVADNIMERIGAQDITFPINVVPPMLRAELAKRGARFGAISGSVASADVPKLEELLQRVNAGEWNAGLEKARAYLDAYESSTEAKMASVAMLSEKLHTPIRVISDPDEIAELPSRRRQRAKGWWSSKNDEVVILLPNNANVADVANTVVHEVVGHKGLRKLIGEERFDEFLNEVYGHASKPIRAAIDQAERKLFDAEVDRLTQQKNAEADRLESRKGIFSRAEATVEANRKREQMRREATEEYMADMAGRIGDEGFEKMGAEELTFWGKVKAKVQQFLDKFLRGLKIGKSIRLTDKDVAYILYKSWKNLRNGGKPTIMDAAEDALMRSKTHYDEIPENDVMFRDGDSVEYRKAQARNLYEQRVSRGLYQMQEAIQDSMLGLKEAMEAVLKAEGGYTGRIEDVAGYENPYLGENRLSSVNQAECAAFAQTLFKPMLEEVARLAKTAKERAELTDYMMAKHGLERNEVMARRAAEKVAHDEFWKELKAAEHTVANEPLDQDAADVLADVKQRMQDRENELYAENRSRDYAGLTALTGKDDVADAESEAEQMVSGYEADHDTTDLWGKVNAVTKATLQKTYECGIISKETFDNISDMYEHYIPLRGFDEKTSDEAYAYLSDKHSAFNAPVKTAKGRKSKADDPFANMEAMAESAIMQGNRNMLVKRKFMRFAQNHPSDLVSISDLWLRYDDVADEWKPLNAGDVKGTERIEEDDAPREVERKMRDFEEEMRRLSESDPDHFKKQKDHPDIPYRVVGDRDLRQHQVLVKQGGKDYVLTINGNPRAAQALNGQTNPDNDASGAMGAILHYGEVINRQLSAFYTTRNPDFVVSNFMRDMLYANTMVWAKESPNYALRFHKNFAEVNPAKMKMLFARLRKGTLDVNNETEKAFSLFMANGGETGYSNIRDIEQRKNDIRRELKKYNGKLPVRKALALLGERFDEYNRAVENCARFAAFMTSRQMKRSIDRSVYDAKEISVNFNKKGSGAKFMNKTGQTPLGNAAALVSGLGRSGFVFWNAAIQGTTNFGRQFKRHPGKALAGAAMFLLGALVAGIAGDDGNDGSRNSYYNLPEYVRRSNIMFRMPGMEEMWVSIPLPVEYRALYGMGELMMSTISGKEHYTSGELAGQIAGQVSQALPIDFMEGGGGFKAFVPSAVKPFAEVMTNKSWTGMPLYKDTPWNKDMPEWTKAYKSANKQLVGLSKVLNEVSGGDAYTSGVIDINPAQVEYLLNGYFGGVSSTIDKFAKMGETALGQREYDPRSFLILNRLVKSGDERTEYRHINNEYFRLKEEHDKLKSRLKHYEEDTNNGVFDYAEKISWLNSSPEYQRLGIFEKYSSYINAINKELKEPMNDNERKELERELYGLKKKLVEEADKTRK